MQRAASAEKQPSGRTRVVRPKADGAGEPRAADQSTWDFTFCKTPASLNNVRTLPASPPQETAAKRRPTIAQILWKLCQGQKQVLVIIEHITPCPSRSQLFYQHRSELVPSESTSVSSSPISFPYRLFCCYDNELILSYPRVNLKPST